MTKVFTEGGGLDFLNMFNQRDGYTNSHVVKGSDLVVLVGGLDVSPDIYGHPRHPTTECNTLRDKNTYDLYEETTRRGIPIVGVCRGGQFINVMNSGKMYQHVSGHCTGRTHKAKYHKTGFVYNVTSTHHQMMKPNPNVGEVVVSSEDNSLGVHWDNGDWVVESIKQGIEGVYFEKKKAISFQPHPEYFQRLQETEKLFFTLIEDYIL